MRNGYTAVALVAALLSTQAAAEGGSPWAVMPCWGGGYVQGATFCPSDPNRMYLYVDVGGPYRSDDAFAYGNSPRRADGLCLSRNPFNPDELVGGEDRSGIFVSRDNGETWALTGPTGVWFTDIRHDAAVPGRVYASAPAISLERMSRMWTLGESRKTPRGFGFFRSDDGART